MSLQVVWWKLTDVLDERTVLLHVEMEALCSSEVPGNLCQTTRRHIPQDGSLHSDRCESLKCRAVSIAKQGLISCTVA